MTFVAMRPRSLAVWLRLRIGMPLSVLSLLWPASLVGRLAEKDWTFEEMFAKSDLVVIAMPISTFATGERTALKDIAPPAEVLGLSTEFQVLLVLKGDKGENKFLLHHYKLDEEPMISGPQLVSFDSKGEPFLLFLVREPDDRYAPVTGQTDPGLYSVIQLRTDAK